jgi:hypothetical protein
MLQDKHNTATPNMPQERQSMASVIHDKHQDLLVQLKSIAPPEINECYPNQSAG